jgi:protein O-mannosyl-transferase
MSRRSEKKAPAVRSGAPVSPAGEMPGAADSRSPESECRPAGWNDRWTVPGVCIFLAAAIWLVFGQTFGYEFVNYDDNLYVADNPAVLGGLSLKGIVWAFTHNVNFNWTPLTVISHMLDCQLYGTQAGWHHLTSVLLHMASAIVLFLVFKGMTGALWRSAFVAAVFAIHPLHVESVAWIAERRDVLSGLFFMLTLGAYAGYVRRPQSLGRYLMVVLMLALALLSKPMVVTLPFVLLLLDYWPLKRFAQPGGRSVPWRLIAEKVPLLALSGAACVATLFAQQEAIQSLPLSLRIGNALVSYVAYLGQMIYPAGLAVNYPYPGNGLALWKIIAAFVLLLVISTGAVATWRKQPWFLIGWLWYLGMLVPAIGLIQSGLRAQADRYTYLPQIGLYVLLTWAVADLCAGWRHRRVVLGGGSASILLALIFCARTQASYWRNSESLWTHTLVCTSDNVIGHNNLGDALLKKGSVNEAIAHFQKALQIKPDYVEACYNLGNALLQKGEVDEAIAQYQKVLQIKPDDAETCYNLGNALLQKGRVDEAITHYQKALQIKPNYAEAHINLGNVLLQRGHVDEAIAQYQKGLQIKPDSPYVLNNLAWLLATSPDAHIRDGVQAVKYANRACELTHYGMPPLVCTLAAADAEAGRFNDAVETAQRALQLAEAQSNTALADAIRSQMKLYQAGLPFHLH